MDLVPFNSRCSMRMGTGDLCSRPSHQPSPGIDPHPCCLLHSADPEKGDGLLLEKFHDEIEAILSDPGARLADFTGFVFPSLDLSSREVLLPCRFFDCSFQGQLLCKNTKFQQNVSFEHARFKASPDFRGSRFIGIADFFSAKFLKGATFAEAVFEQQAYFSNALFYATANFHSVRFTGPVRFRKADFHADETNGQASSDSSPTPVFSLASFGGPTLFYQNHLEQALFINSDVSRVNFSSVFWRTRENNGKAMLFEEQVPLENEFADPLKKPSGERDFRLISETYQQLKKNYDQRRDYWTAGDFHYGEMEMQRLSIRERGRLLFFRRWWHPRLSLLAWYKYASLYGESYARPLALMFATLVLATLLFGELGLQQEPKLNAGKPNRVTYESAWRAQSSVHDRARAELKVLAKSAIAALDTATFQRTPEYAPSYPWGRLAAIFETLLISSFLALFLLAVRRQFRR